MAGQDDKPDGIGARPSLKAMSRRKKRDDRPDVLSWLLNERVTIPDRVAGYLDRPKLSERISPTERRITILIAPGGFGKTTVLAETCRSLVDSGILTAWLTLDSEDASGTLDAYLAFAFRKAGLNVLDTLAGQAERMGPPDHRTALVIQAIERHGAHCVLALDELELLGNPASVSLLDHLVKWGPPNLHIAVACRELPAGVDIATPMLAGQGALVTADHLRFSRSEVARFFGSKLTRGQVASVARESGGWPIALRILQNEWTSGVDVGVTGLPGIAENWMESRLWRGLSDADRNLALDVGLFEWVEPTLLDEVLCGRDLQRRVEAITGLAGLFESAGGRRSEARRLHSLIRKHCTLRRLRETPERFRSVHRRIALALARRNETVLAMRHASTAGDADLVARILTDVGGVRLWIREGLLRLQAAVLILTPETMDGNPRLALAHCVVLLMTGRLGEARSSYAALRAGYTDSSGGNPMDDVEYRFDDCTVRGLFCIYGCESVGSENMRSAMADNVVLAEARELDPVLRGCCELGLCIAHNMRAEFDAALDRVERAGQLVHSSDYETIFVGLQRGQIAMAQGRVARAVTCYAQAESIARASFLRDPGPAVLADVFIQELDLERHRLAAKYALEIPRALTESGTPLAAYAAAAGVVSELMSESSGPREALAAVEVMREYSCSAGLPALTRYLGALRASLIVRVGRIGDVEDAWRTDGLPGCLGGILDLGGQSWREMEAVAEARLRYLVAREDYEEGRRLVRSLVDVAIQRGLRRTQMRGLALSSMLERRAGRREEAIARMHEFVRLYGETDYTRPLVREREDCLPVLEDLLDTGSDPIVVETAVRLHGHLQNTGEVPAAIPKLSQREFDILQRLEAQRDREIAEALDLSEAGVRYHITNIFGKLGVRGRWAAVQRARRLGVFRQSS